MFSVSEQTRGCMNSCMTCMSMDIVQLINPQRLLWLCHVIRMEEDFPTRRVFDVRLSESRQSG